MVEDHGFQTPLRLTSGPAVDHRTVDDTDLDSFEHPNPFPPLDDEDEDAVIETYLRLQRKHRASPLRTPVDRPRVKPDLRPTPLPMQAQTTSFPAIPFAEEAAMGGVESPKNERLNEDAVSVDSGQVASARVHARQTTTQDNSPRQNAPIDHEDAANDFNAAGQNQTEDDEDTQIRTKKRKTKKTTTGAMQKLTASAIATLESLPDRPTLSLL